MMRQEPCRINIDRTGPSRGNCREITLDIAGKYFLESLAGPFGKFISGAL